MTDVLEELLAGMPSEEASELEKEAFVEKVMAVPGGAELIRDFASKITAGGSLDAMLKEEASELESLSLKSPMRFIFRVELLETRPLIWRRVSLPGDCAFVHLHAAIQDAFGWEDKHGHCFEVWEEGRLELSFGSADDEYCEVENRVEVLFCEEVYEFIYRYDLKNDWRHRIVIEELVPAGEMGTLEESLTCLHDGRGHAPPEDCGGPVGFQMFLTGEHPLCRDYETEILEEFRNGQPDFSKITFRGPAAVSRRFR